MKAIALLISFFCLLPLLGGEEPVQIRAHRIYTVSQGVIENGYVQIRGREIVAVGPVAQAPAVERVYEFKDGAVYPGLINALTTLGLTGIGSLGVANDSRESGDFNPHISAYTAFYPWSNLIPISFSHGTMTALSVPQGGLVCGKGFLFGLNDGPPDQMLIRPEAALFVQVPEESGGRMMMARERAPDAAQLSKRKKELRDFFNLARQHYRKWKQGEAGDFDIRLAAMRDVWQKPLPVILAANSVDAIREAIQLAKEFELKAILYGVAEGEKVLEEIKKSGLPVILGSMYAANRKWEDGYDQAYRLPGLLARAAVPVAFSATGSATAFDLTVQAGRAVAYGLPPEEALKALTCTPAALFGLDDLGAVAPAKTANLVVTDGDILETSTRVLALFYRGQKVEVRDFFQTEVEKARDHKGSDR